MERDSSDAADDSGLMQTADLLGRARSGDAAARDELFQHYRPLLESFLGGRLPGGARGALDTQDLVQDVCVHAAASLDRFQYRGVGSFWAYLRTIGKNLVRDHGRKDVARGRSAPLPEESMAEPPDAAASVGADLLKKEDLARFDRELERVPEREQNALLMRLELDLEYKAIAVECGYPSPDAARMAVTRALEQIIARMAEDGST